MIFINFILIIGLESHDKRRMPGLGRNVVFRVLHTQVLVIQAELDLVAMCHTKTIYNQ